MKLAKMPDGTVEIYDAVQGEGFSMGIPMAFVRLSLCNLQCNFCLVGGTQITMADGSTKNIERIEEGDEVISFDPDSKVFEKDVVSATMSRVSHLCEILLIELDNGKKLEITGNHEVLTERGWVLAKDLQESDRIVIDAT